MIDGVSATVEACRCARVCEKEFGGRDTPVTPAIGERATDESDDTGKGQSEKGVKKRKKPAAARRSIGTL